MWTGERDSPQVEHFQAATESVEKKHRKEERAISSQRWDESMSLQPCKHAVQTGRHTPCLPTARPQPSYHLCPGHGAADNCHLLQGLEVSDKHPLFSMKAPGGSYLGWDQKGAQGHQERNVLLSPAAPAAEGPHHGSTPGKLPFSETLQELIISSVPQSRSICTAPLPAGSARERLFCYCILSRNTEPHLFLALSGPLYCRAESKGPFPSAYI